VAEVIENIDQARPALRLRRSLGCGLPAGWRHLPGHALEFVQKRETDRRQFVARARYCHHLPRRHAGIQEDRGNRAWAPGLGKEM